MKRFDSENSNSENIEEGRSFGALILVIFGCAANCLVFFFYWLLVLIRGRYELDEGDSVYALLLAHVWVLIGIINSGVITISVRSVRQVSPFVATLCFMFMLVPAYAALVPWYWVAGEPLEQNFMHLWPLAIGIPILYAGAWWLAIPVAAQWPPKWKSWPIVAVVVGVFTTFFLLTSWK